MFLLAAALLMQPATDPPVDWDKEFGVEEKVRDPVTGELPVDSYVQANGNAGAAPFAGSAMATAFGGQDGIRRIANRTVELSEADPRLAAIFQAHDMVRLKRTLFEQFCYILNAGCDYSGRDMASSHKDMGVRMRDMNALVENLQAAMREGKIGFAAQNRFLGKLAPMSGHVITR
ncbi:group 1 truncated hemoglobin [Sphingopyxis sp.]|jgi:hemoglobin|uniref:group I truncated hemoglobin n=1 Tax=Sphingopyxis sp. TaxID=1908224 RepID=UPI0025F9CA54|nr:group 1 truncated hemoglobin [Sphingopyxis sp.]MBK6412166.1 group 1 truncated hemoglobin [Sphingopyxis sp.]